MRTAKQVELFISELPEGQIFSYRDLGLDASNREAVIKYLNRLASKNIIKKLVKGKFYKAINSKFGTLAPSQDQIVKDLLEKNGKTIGYLTGYSTYNELGLSSQLSTIIQIGRNETRAAFSRGIYKIHLIKQKNKITKKNIPLLKILDAIRFIKKIPDSTIDQSCLRLIAIIKSLSDSELSSLIKLALVYPPAARALLGALLERAKRGINTEFLLESLNPISIYSLSVSRKVLPNALSWNIK